MVLSNRLFFSNVSMQECGKTKPTKIYARLSYKLVSGKLSYNSSPHTIKNVKINMQARPNIIEKARKWYCSTSYISERYILPQYNIDIVSTFFPALAHSAALEIILLIICCLCWSVLMHLTSSAYVITLLATTF